MNPLVFVVVMSRDVAPMVSPLNWFRAIFAGLPHLWKRWFPAATLKFQKSAHPGRELLEDKTVTLDRSVAIFMKATGQIPTE